MIIKYNMTYFEVTKTDEDVYWCKKLTKLLYEKNGITENIYCIPVKNARIVPQETVDKIIKKRVDSV